MKSICKSLIAVIVITLLGEQLVWAVSDEYMLGSRIGEVATICYQLSDLKAKPCPMFQTAAPNACLFASIDFLSNKHMNQVKNSFNTTETVSKYSRDARYVNDINYQTALKEAANDPKRRVC